MKKWTKVINVPENKRFTMTCAELTPKGERLDVEFTCMPMRYKKPYDLGRSWLANGYIKEKSENFWHVSTYATDKKGNCYGKYNPTIRMKKEKIDGKTCTRAVIDFDWMLEATDENMTRILEEVEQRAFMKEVKK